LLARRTVIHRGESRCVREVGKLPGASRWPKVALGEVDPFGSGRITRHP
jgi:hypothetical protein